MISFIFKYSFDSIVIFYQQVARYLVKSFRQCRTSDTILPESVQYLDSSKLSRRKFLDIECIKNIVDQFQQVAYGQVKEAVQSIDHWTDIEKKRFEDAWNNSSIELASAALSHVRYFIMNVFASNLISDLLSISTPLKSVLLSLFKMLAFTWMQQNYGDFLRYSGVKVRPQNYF